MHDEPARVNYMVRQVGADRWEVNRSGVERPIASFPDRHDAIEFAEHMSTASGLVEVRTYH